ncbi:hypothetical protein DL96DRAFT_875665 [Flagelloscypha sp. PMI_526]|nr:hypothetical protein DL96DRAFT_875665 [Flagelloscypha sp. PMI_526]
MSFPTVLDLPIEVLSHIFNYFPFACDHEDLYTPIVNPTLLAGILVCSHFATAVRPMLWAQIGVTSRPRSGLLALLALLSASPEICLWVREVSIFWSSHVGTHNDEYLASLMRLLPAIRTLRLHGAKMKRGECNNDIPSFGNYPSAFQQALYQCTLPGLTHLHILNLHSIPYTHILRRSPTLEILEVTQASIRRRTYPSPLSPIIPSASAMNLSRCSVKQLRCQGSHLYGLLEPKSGLTPLPALQHLSTQLSHLSLFGAFDTSNTTLWSDSIVSIGVNLQYLGFTLDLCNHHLYKRVSLLALMAPHSLSNLEIPIPGMEKLDLGQLPRLKEVEIALLAEEVLPDWLNGFMEQVVSFLSTAITLSLLRLHVVHEDVRQDLLPAFCWTALDQVLYGKGLDVKVSVADAHPFVPPTDSTDTPHEDAAWIVVQKALPLCWGRGQLEFDPPTERCFR